MNAREIAHHFLAGKSYGDGSPVLNHAERVASIFPEGSIELQNT